MPQVRDLLQSHAIQTYYLLDPDGTHESRLGDVADSYYAMPEDLTPDTVRYFRNQLAESLGKQIASRWVGKVKADQQHFARHWLVQDLVEGYDIAAEVADTGWDFIKGLWDIGCLVVSLAGDAIVLQIKFHQQLMKSIGDLASGDLEAIEKDLNDAGIYLTQKLTSAQQLKATIERGYDTFQLLVDDAQTKQLIKDYFDSLYESTTYRDSRTIAVRVVAEIGLEVLIALATVGIGNVARRTGQAAHKADKAVDLVRAGEMVGPFTREAIEIMADLAHGLRKGDISLSPTKPAKDIDVPEYAKPVKKPSDVDTMVAQENVPVDKPLVGQLEPGNPRSTSSPRNGDRLVLDQGQLPTCGPNSCAMVLDSSGRAYDLDKLIVDSKVTSQGAYMGDMAKALRNQGLDTARVRNRVSIEELAEATSGGNPAVVATRLDRGGHAVVVDGITTRQGQQVVAIRDPALGRQYFTPLEEFVQRFSGQAILTNPKKP